MNDIDFELPAQQSTRAEADLELLALVDERDWQEEQPPLRPACQAHEWAPIDIIDTPSEKFAWRCCWKCQLIQAVSLTDILARSLAQLPEPEDVPAA